MKAIQSPFAVPAFCCPESRGTQDAAKRIKAPTVLIFIKRSPVVLHELPASLDKLAEGSLRRAEGDELRRRHPVWFVCAHEFRHLAQPFDGACGYGPVDALLA